MPTKNIHPEHNVIADLDNWIVSAKITRDEREKLDEKEIENIKEKRNSDFLDMQMQVLKLEKHELELRKENQELTDKYQESQHHLTQLQIQEIKRKTLFAILGALGGAILTIITEYALGVLKLK